MRGGSERSVARLTLAGVGKEGSMSVLGSNQLKKDVDMLSKVITLPIVVENLLRDQYRSAGDLRQIGPFQ